MLLSVRLGEGRFDIAEKVLGKYDDNIDCIRSHCLRYRFFEPMLKLLVQQILLCNMQKIMLVLY